MSGHSKWANIKNKKAKGDAARSNIFTKIGREIAVAVKNGGPNPDTNSKLKDVIAKARANNMPNDNIMRGIKKAAGETGSVNYEEMMYEGYGIGGVAVLVEALTDNKNRTAGDVRHNFDKFGGSLGQSGCVSYLFDRKGVVIIEKNDKITEDEVMESAIECGAEDMQTSDDVFEIYTEPQDLSNIAKELEDKGYTILSYDVDMIPQNTVALSEEQQARFEKMIDALDELDDVQNIYHNAELND